MDAGTVVSGVRTVGEVTSMVATPIKAIGRLIGCSNSAKGASLAPMRDTMEGLVELTILFGRQGFTRESAVLGGGIAGKSALGIGGQKAAHAGAHALTAGLPLRLVRRPIESVAESAGHAAGRLVGEPVGRAVTGAIWDGTESVLRRIEANRARRAAATVGELAIA